VDSATGAAVNAAAASRAARARAAVGATDRVAAPAAVSRG
jgi:hypothetical protein